MVAKAVTRAWQASLAEALPAGRARDRDEVEGAAPPSSGGWQRPPQHRHVPSPPIDDGDDDPAVRVSPPGDIVPKRRGVTTEPVSLESFWSSHHFWKGVVVGAVIVLVIKTAIAVRAPHGVDWFGF